MILTPSEHELLYGVPTLNADERTYYFTFNDAELEQLKRFKKIENAVYFAINLAFFKLRYTFITFSYRDVTKERQYIIKKYFPHQPVPKSLPTDKNTLSDIRQIILKLVAFKRFKGQDKQTFLKKFSQKTPLYPRQRQLCQAFLKQLIDENIVIPAYSTVQETVRQLWNEHLNTLTRRYKRYSTQTDRKAIAKLLAKTDSMHRIISIRKDMKGFKNHDIHDELEKHAELRCIFMIAKNILPRLKLPKATIHYYSELINHYNGSKLNTLQPDRVQLYLLCYGFTRFQIINDNLLEALKKRTHNYSDTFKKSADKVVTNYMADMTAMRQKIYDLLMLIKEDTHKKFIPKSKIFECIPYTELDTVAHALINEKLDPESMYWQQVDEHQHVFQANLRKIFLSLDITIRRDEPFKKVVQWMKNHLVDPTKSSTFPAFINAWIPPKILRYIVDNHDAIIPARMEFFFYTRLAYHISTCKLVLDYSIKFKDIDDNLINLPTWNKNKSTLLQQLTYKKIATSPILLMEELDHTLPELYKKVNHAITSGENSEVLVKNAQSGDPTWRLKPLDKATEPNERLFTYFQKRSIVDIMNFVNKKTGYLQAFESILPRYGKNQPNNMLINAVIVANALRMGSHAMANICDLSLSSLITTEKNYVRMETVNHALHQINLALSKLDIFKDYHIQGRAHISLDGLKVGSRQQNISARHSPKFLGKDAGVSSYNLIFNYLSITGKLISSNQYEGHYTFEMMTHQNVNDFTIDCASTDKHGINSLNFALFDLTDYAFAPRIPKPHHQTLWGLGHHKHYQDLLIKPHKIASKQHVIKHWDDIQRTLVSMLCGEVMPSVIIGQMSSQQYRSPTKLAFSHYNHLIRSEFILNYIHSKSYRRAIECALNRGEAYNGLYRAITLLNGGKFRGQSETEMMIWDQCTKLIAAIILYYNTYILNHLYSNTHCADEKEWLLHLSPGAWVHINLLGYYQFHTTESDSFVEKLLSEWDWHKILDNV